MMRSVLVLVFLAVVVSSGFAQEKKKIGRPDIPGTFVVDFGFNRGNHEPTNFTQGFWGSRTLNVYYQYPVRIAKSSFSFVPGIGLGMDRFKLTNNYTLSPTKATDGTFPLVDARTLYVDPRRSQLIMNYVDVPIGIRFDTHPEDLSRSFSLSAGGRFGVLYDGFTKVTYSQDGETKVVKDKQKHGLNSFRSGLYGRLGIGGFNIFTYYNLTPLFAANQGPAATTMNTWTIGISLNGF